MKIFIIACETSGDLHAAELISAMKKLDPGIQFRGLGGPRMAQTGMTLLRDMTAISVLGLGDVLRMYGTYREIFYQALKDLKQWEADVLILVDSPAFNLRFAKKIRRENKQISILYYICPQIWAWGRRRIHTVRKNISRMFAILPFEVGFYQEEGVPCEFVGHPLLDHVDISADKAKLRQELAIAEDEKAIGLLPGSRRTEVKRILPIMLRCAEILHEDLPQTKFFLARSDNVPKALYDKLIARSPLAIENFDDRFNDRVAAMDFALVTSGTATLQTALLGTPFFLLYKASWSTYFLGKHLIKVPHLGLVNLLAGREIVPEFIQWDAHPETIAHEAKILLANPDLQALMRSEFADIREKLGKSGASLKAAKSMTDFLNRPKAAKEIRD